MPQIPGPECTQSPPRPSIGLWKSRFAGLIHETWAFASAANVVPSRSSDIAMQDEAWHAKRAIVTRATPRNTKDTAKQDGQNHLGAYKRSGGFEGYRA